MEPVIQHSTTLMMMNVLKDSVSDEDQDVIEEMMEKIEDNTCLRFRWIVMKENAGMKIMI